MNHYPTFVQDAISKLTSKQLRACSLLADPESDLSHSAIAESIGVQVSTISMWKSRNTRGFNEALLALTMYNASRFFVEASKEWLKLIRKGHWKAIDKSIDFAMAYQGFVNETDQSPFLQSLAEAQSGTSDDEAEV